MKPLDVEILLEDPLHGEAREAAAGMGTTGGLDSLRTIPLGQADDSICGPQAVHRSVPEDPLDVFQSRSADLLGSSYHRFACRFQAREFLVLLTVPDASRSGALAIRKLL